MGRLVMAYWDCPYCSNKGIGGNMRECPGCGRPRGDVKFYMKQVAAGAVLSEAQAAGIEHVSDEEAAKIDRRADWFCSYCDCLNTAGDNICKGCGATKEDSDKNYFDLKRIREEKERARAEAKIPQVNTGVKKSSKKFLLIGGLIILGFILLGVWLGSKKTTANVISDMGWERSIAVERYTNVDESDWRLPSGGNLHETKREIHHYDQILDHYEEREVERSRTVLDHYETTYTYEDLGNGYYEEVSHSEPVYTTEYYTEIVSEPIYVSVPVYETKYYYDIWKWLYERSESSKGHDKSVYWPELNLTENEREAGRDALYYFSVQDEKGKTKTYSVKETEWNKLSVGDDITITEKRSGSEAYISDSEGNKLCDLEKIDR